MTRPWLPTFALLVACGGSSGANVVERPEPREPRCPDAAPLYALAAENIRDRPELGLPAVELADECDEACRRDAEARLDLDVGALDDCAGGGERCELAWSARLVHVQPAEAGRCAFGVVEAELGWETPIGIWVRLTGRTSSVELDDAGELRVREPTLAEDDPDRRAGPTFGDLDGDGHADWLLVRVVEPDHCFGPVFDTGECQGFGLPAARVVEVRGEGGLLTEPLPRSGMVLTPALRPTLERAPALETCDGAVDECPEELDVEFVGRRAAGAPVARRIDGGFAVDQVVEEVDCAEACVTPLGDVCTERPSEEYGIASEACRTRGWVLESHLVRGGEVDRETRPAANGVIARARCADGCSMQAVMHPLGDGDPTLHRSALPWPDHAYPVWRSEGGTLGLPTGVFLLDVLRSEEGPHETWLVTITAETEDLDLSSAGEWP